MIVMVELPPPGAGIGLGLKPTVVPDGTPEADKLIELLKPPLTVVVMVDVPCLPWVTLSEEGDAERLKPGVEPPANALISPLPFGLPQPVAKS